MNFGIDDSLSFVQELIASMQGKKIICYGAGAEFAKFIKYCCTDKKLLPMPEYVCDGNHAAHGSKICGVLVAPPERLMQEDQDEIFIVITGCHLEVAGIINTTSGCYFHHMMPSWSFDAFSVYKDRVWELENVEEALCDDVSKYQFNAFVNNMLTGAIFMPRIFTPGPYYGNDVIRTLRDDETVILCGAYDGKHVERARKLSKKAKFHLFEPNAQSAQLLREKFADDEKITVHQYAVHDKPDELLFDDSTPLQSKLADFTTRIDQNGQVGGGTVSAVRLDETVREKVDLIAMDIEGAEYKALCGAQGIIDKHRPKLAISLYHSFEEYLDLPRLVQKLDSSYKLYFRHHGSYRYDSVLYAL